MNEGKKQSSLRMFVADYLKSPGPAGPQGQTAAILEQKPKSPNPELGGLDKNKGQAIGPLGKAEYDKAEEIVKEVGKWVNEQGVTTIIIENHSSKELTFADDQNLSHTDQAKWVKKAPPTIAAGGKDKIIVKTDMMIRGVKRGDTSGYAVYKVFGKDKTTPVRIAWSRKGDGGLDKTGSWADGPYEIDGSQTNEGEFTFLFTDLVPATPPTQPQAPATKSAEPPPPDTVVNFDVGKSVLKAEATSKLHEFGLAYVASKSTAKVYAEGYASIEGLDADNTNLSFERAQAVFKYLTDPNGENLPKDKVHYHGSGVTKDFDPKNFPPNRCVTVSLTPPKGTAAPAPATEPKEPQSPADPKAKVPESRDNEEPPNRPLNPASASRTGA